MVRSVSLAGRCLELNMASHRLSEASFHAINYAMILSDLQKSTRLEIYDLLSAMYLANLDRLSKYWEELSGFELLALGHPAARQLAADISNRGSISIFEHRGGVGGIFKPFSLQFKKVHSQAIELALGHAGHLKTIVFPEHFLLAIVEQADLEITRRLLSSGLQVEVLRRDVEKGISQ
jgi:hypothetical protein